MEKGVLTSKRCVVLLSCVLQCCHRDQLSLVLLFIQRLNLYIYVYAHVPQKEQDGIPFGLATCATEVAEEASRDDFVANLA